MSALEDVDNQKRGFVMVGYNLGKSVMVKERIWYNSLVLMGVPFRMLSFHVCYDNPGMPLLCSTSQRISEDADNLTFPIHSFQTHSQSCYDDHWWEQSCKVPKLFW